MSSLRSSYNIQSRSHCLKLVSMLVGLCIGVNPSVAAAESNIDAINFDGTFHEYTLPPRSSPYIELHYLLRSTDSRVVAFYIRGPKGLRLSLTVHAEKGRLGRSRAAKRWPVTFLDGYGNVETFLTVKDDEGIGIDGVGIIQADACERRNYYALSLVIDASRTEYDEGDIFFLGAVLGHVPRSQQTLFKFPSEKNPSQAVLLMRTGDASPYVNLVSWRHGIPRILRTFRVDEYYFHQGLLFTRLYLPGAMLSGEQVTIEHISADLTDTYGVCARLMRKRQQLEGYMR